MDSSTSFSQKLSIQKEKISNSKTNAVIRTRFDKAVDEIKKGGLLDGKTFLIKDNIAIKSEPLSCASKILKSYISPFNATAVERIQKAGGLITGQTNCDEFAMGSSSEYSIYGSVKNPHNLDLVAGGSSGGSAAAIAENLADIALGSDTGGSVRQPAAFCGIYGLKPTYGRVSRYGLVAHASSFDTIGIMSKEIDNIRKTLSIISGKDRKDATSVDLKVDDYKPFDTISLPTSLGVIKEELLDELNLEIADRYRYLVSYLKSKNVKIKEIDLPFFKYSIPTYYVLTMAEASSNLSRFDGVRYGNRVDSADLSELYLKSRTEGFSDEVKRRIMTGTYVLSSGYYDAYYLKAQRVRKLIKNDFDEVYKKVDAILTPSTPSSAFKIGEKKDDPVSMYLNDIFTVPVNLAGLPGISIPAGHDLKGYPLGLQIIGKAFDEQNILNIAYAMEEKIGFKNKINDWWIK